MKRFILLFFLICLSVVSSFSAGTKYFSLSRAEAFNKGERENITITENGNLELSAALKQIYAKNDLIINDIALDKNGNIYIATSNKGILYKLAKDGKITEFFKASTFSVSTITLSENGIYAAIMPEAEIWFIDFEGKAKKIAKMDERYIWRIKYYRELLYVSCGSSAVLYSIDKNGVKKQLYKNTGDNHFQAMTISKNKIYFGSEGKGALYEYSITEGKVKVLYEAYESEITDIAVSKSGAVYFITGTVKKIKLPQSNFDYTDTFVRQLQGIQRFSAETPYLKNSLYVYQSDGKVKKLFTKDNFLLLSLAVLDDGTIYIGTGNLGIIFKITPDGKAHYSFRLTENQVMCFIKISSHSIFVGTGNPGRVYKLDNSVSPRGVYTSTVYDAKAVSSWGKIYVESTVPASASVLFETRSGDTSRPDNTWSAWASVGAENKVNSPRARFLQFRLIMQSTGGGNSPIIRKIRIPFLRDNRAPEVTNVIFKKGVAQKKTGAIDPSICSLAWSAFDADNDQLIYNVSIKRKGFKKWIVVLKRTKELSVTFDSMMFPDGEYHFKITASDELNNPVGRMLEAERISEPVIIDNTPPQILDVRVKASEGKYLLTFTVEDKLSNIAAVQISVNYGKIVFISPEDGIFDSKLKRFSYLISKTMHEELNNGENAIIIKAIDAAGNYITVIKKTGN